MVYHGHRALLLEASGLPRSSCTLAGGQWFTTVIVHSCWRPVVYHGHRALLLEASGLLSEKLFSMDDFTVRTLIVSVNDLLHGG